MWGLPISELFMVGKKSALKLEKLGIKTIKDLANIPKENIAKKFGKYGSLIWEYANGIDLPNSCFTLSFIWFPISNNVKPFGIQFVISKKHSSIEMLFYHGLL